MKRKNAVLWGILAIVLVFGIVASGCSTTYSINYSSAEQPKGEYKYIVISSNSSNNTSVLQRFYSKYPSNKYEVVAVEMQRKNWIPFLFGLGGGVFGGIIGLASGAGSEGSEVTLIVSPIAALSIGSICAFIGNHFKDKYIVTYVERSNP